MQKCDFFPKGTFIQFKKSKIHMMKATSLYTIAQPKGYH